MENENINFIIYYNLKLVCYFKFIIGFFGFFLNM